MVPRHDDIGQNRDENQKASWGIGSRARIEVNGRTIRTEPRLMKVRGFFYCPQHDPEKWAPVFRKDHAQNKVT
jgi:hypothetical protein